MTERHETNRVEGKLVCQVSKSQLHSQLVSSQHLRRLLLCQYLPLTIASLHQLHSLVRYYRRPHGRHSNSIYHALALSQQNLC